MALIRFSSLSLAPRSIVGEESSHKLEPVVPAISSNSLDGFGASFADNDMVVERRVGVLSAIFRNCCSILENSLDPLLLCFASVAVVDLGGVVPSNNVSSNSLKNCFSSLSGILEPLLETDFLAKSRGR
jgi:hypothetical protein